jgi:polyisoprenyl-phosphate glycosyltransferase
MKKIISIVITAYNEQESIPLLAKQLFATIKTIKKYNFEVIFVENGSYDNTLQELLKQRKKNKEIKILQLSKNVGWDEGIIAGLTFAKGEAAILMVADLQDDPKLITTFLKKWESGYDIVYTVIKKRVRGKVSFAMGIYVFNKLMNAFTKKLLPENASEYGLLDKKVYKTLVALPEHNKFFRGLVQWVGFRKTSVVRERQDRLAGKSKATLFTAIRFAFNGMTSFSYVPLKFPYALAVLLFITSLLSFFVLSVETAIFIFLFALLFFILGLQGEYIERVLDEVRNRPKFIVQKTFGLNKK